MRETFHLRTWALHRLCLPSGNLGPLLIISRHHGARYNIPEKRPRPFETYVQVLTQAMGVLKIMVASRYYGKGAFYLAIEAAMQEAVENGLTVGGEHVSLEFLEELGTWVVLSPILPCITNWALMPFSAGPGESLLPHHHLLSGVPGPQPLPDPIIPPPSHHPAGVGDGDRGDLYCPFPGAPQMGLLLSGEGEALPVPGAGAPLPQVPPQSAAGDTAGPC